jgi:hypothetical protein
MATPFDTYSLEKATEIVGTRYDLYAQKAVNFYNGDHWQEGDGWIGPQYDTDSKFFKPTMKAIEKNFISHNVISEMVERHVSGVLGRELHWKMTLIRDIPEVQAIDPLTGQPKVDPVSGEPVMEEGKPEPGEEALIGEAETLLVDWWNERNVLETLKHAVSGLLLTQRSPLRFSIPPGLRNEAGQLPPTDLAGALEMLYLDHMGYDEDTLKQILPSATVYTDKNTRREVGIFVYPEDTEGELREERFELTYLDEERSTVLRIHTGRDEAEPIRMPLGGRLLMHEMRGKPLVSPQIMSQQRSLNKTLTMKDRNDTQGGFLERYLLNVKWPGKWTEEAGERKFVPEAMHTGPGTMNSLQGSTFTDEAGQVHVLNPQVIFRDPVPATTFIESADHTYLAMLKEGKQLHHANANESAVSGESRKQARASYTKALQDTANIVETAVRWVLETALAQASFLAGQPGRFEGLRAYVQAKIDAGPVSADDMRVAAEMMDRGLWDWETAVSATGVDDVDAIKQRLESEQRENAERAMAFEDAFGAEDDAEAEEDEPTPAAAGRFSRNGAR